MSRLLTCGFEMGYVAPQVGTGYQIEDPLVVTGGNNSGAACVVANDQARSGQYSLKVGQTGTSGTYALMASVITGVLTRTYWNRVAVRFGAMGTSGTDVVTTYSTGLAGGMRVRISAARVLTVTNYASTRLLTGPTLALNTWYVLEWQHTLSTGAGQFWVDGVSYGTYTADVATAGTPQHSLWCPTGATGGHLMWFDDWAINDDQGTSQNGRIGNQGKIVLLKPISDNARTGFTTGAAGTTSLFDAVDNVPPVGVVLASATAASQIKDATSNTTDSYTANLAAYSTAVASGGGGIAAADQITLVQGVVQHGNSSATSRTNGLTVAANPAIAEATGTTGTTAAGAMPTGWTTLKSVVAVAPSVALGTSPTVKFRKGTASTDSSMADFVGLYVEYIPVLPQAVTGTAQATAAATTLVAAATRLTPTASAVATATAQVATAPNLTPVASAATAASAQVITPAPLTPAAVATTRVLAPYKDMVLATAGLVSYWRLNERAGATAADQKGVQPLTIGSTVALNQASSLGDADPAMHCDGTATGYLSSDTLAVPLQLASAFTLECWVKPDDVTGTYFFVTLDANDIWLSQNGQWLVVGYALQGGGFGQVVSGNVMTTGWQHVAMSWDGATVNAYRNGVLVGSTPSAGAAVVPAKMAIGAIAGGFNIAQAAIDEVAVYNVGLSAATLANHYAAGPGAIVLTAPVRLAPAATAQATATVTAKAPVGLTPVAQVQTQATAAATAAVRLAASAQAVAQATVAITAPANLSPSASAMTLAAATVGAATMLSPSAQAFSAATVSLTAATSLLPLAQARTQAAASIAAAVALAPSAAALAQALALVSASPPPLFPASAGARGQATALVTAPVLLLPVSAESSAGQALVTVATRIAVAPVQATVGAGALVTVATQISIEPVLALVGAGAAVSVAAVIQLTPVQASSQAGEVTNNVTAPVLLSGSAEDVDKWFGLI